MAKTKRGPLSKVEAFYVQHNYPEMDVAKLAVELDRPIRSIENYIKKNIVKSKKLAPVNASDQFVRQGGATVMTENASTIADDIKKQVQVSKKSCITKIKPDG